MSWIGKISYVVGLANKAVEKTVEEAVERGCSLFQSEVTRYKNVEKELERLRRTSVRINALLTDAEERRHIEDYSVKVWLRDLKSVSFDTDNLLDEYQTALGVHKLNNYSSNAAGSTSRKRKLNQFLSIGPAWDPFQRRRLASQVDEIDNRLAEIAKCRKTLTLKGNDGAKREPSTHHRAPPFQTGPIHDQTIIIGREDDKNNIVELLISDLRLRVIPVVPIYGTAGIGKTTLAQLVYNDPRIRKHFKFRAWACLTDRCDATAAMKEIYEKMTGCDFRSNDVQSRLRDYLKTRKDDKFLLVIDNLWANDLYFWETLRAPLLAGGEGSKVVITTRNERTCLIMSGLIRQPSLKGLEKDECWQLIKSLALPQDIMDHDHEKVIIGNEIATRCHGSPLAAKALGALLNSRNEEEWGDVLSEMRALKDDQNGVVLVGLKISYHHLPYHLKQCFAYCSIFPNGYVFERDRLIRYWMAEGLIQPDGRRRLEAVGNKYFDELIWRSFFEKMPISDKSRVERFIMPSLMCDLGMLVSQCGKNLPEPKGDSPDQARYASFLQPKDEITVKIEYLEPYSNLRTLTFCGECCGDKDVPLNSIPKPFFLKFMHLRVLDMSYSNLEYVPDSVGKLIHLRFLGLSHTKIITLPETICDLFNLQTLELKGCSKLVRLPEGLVRLINLRHLDLHLDWEEINDSTEVAIPQGIGALEHLQTISRFNVASSKGQACNINELNDLKLRGDLCILNLEKVPTAEDAKNANLEGKEFVENLMLRWNNSGHTDQLITKQSEEVINSLQPSKRLRCLWIINYPGINFPHWIRDEPFLSLGTIRISNCKNFDFLPLLGQLPRLKNLQIENVSRYTMSIPGGFPSLEYLILLNLSSLVRLYVENEIPKLKEIYVSDCPALQEVVSHRNLHDKFERSNCPNFSRITCVPQD